MKGLFLVISIFSSMVLSAQGKITGQKQLEKENLLMEAKKAVSFGQPDDARKHYLEALKIDRQCDVCYYDLSNLYANASMFQRAYQMSGMAYRLDSLNSWYILQHARLAYYNKQYAESERLYSNLLKLYPDKQEVWLSLASSYEEQGNTDRALAILDSMQMRYGVNDDILYRRYNIYVRTNQADKALKLAEELAGNNSSDQRFLTLLADTYTMVGNDSLALSYYDKALAVDNTFSPAMLGRAENYRKSGNFKHYFKLIQEYASNKLVEPREKAEYFGMLLEIPSFAQYFKANIDTIFVITSYLHPTSIPLKYLQATYFMNIDRLPESLSLLNTIVQMDSSNFNAWNGIISIQYNMKRWPDMYATSTKASKLFPKYPTFTMYRSVALWQQDELKDAIGILEKGTKQFKADTSFLSQAHAMIGDLYHQRGKGKKAFKNYQLALDFNPNNASVLNNYAYYLSMENKNLPLAYDMSKRSLDLDGGNHIFLDTFAYILYLQGKYTEAKAVFRQALASGGKGSSVILEHYADTLYKLGEFDTAEIYWQQALESSDCKNPEEIKEKIIRVKNKQ